MHGSPSIRSIAKEAGVSIATVSLALRNHPKIRLKERQRIQRIAAAAGYKTNALLASLLAQLRSSRTVIHQSTLGLLYIGHEPDLLKVAPTFLGWAAGCEAQAASRGYGLDRFSLSNTEPGQIGRLVKILHARNITGLVVTGPFQNTVVTPYLDVIWQRSAAVVVGARPIHPPLAFASNDQFSTAAQAAAELARLGYRRPGLCVAAHINHAVENRFSGGFWASQDEGPVKNRIPIFNFEPGASARFQSWVKRYRPDSIVTLHAEIAEWLKSMGLFVPRDIGLLHLDRSPEMEGWAGMQQNNEFIGRAAVDMVIGQLHRNEFGVPQFQKCMFITGTMIDGSSVRKQGGAAPRAPRARQGRAVASRR